MRSRKTIVRGTVILSALCVHVARLSAQVDVRSACCRAPTDSGRVASQLLHNRVVGVGPGEAPGNQRTTLGRYMLIGAVAGGVVGGIAGIKAVRGNAESLVPGGLVVFMYAGAGAFAGFLVGGIVHSLTHRSTRAAESLTLGISP